jgi:Outer membrane protein beta-barrel domain
MLIVVSIFMTKINLNSLALCGFLLLSNSQVSQAQEINNYEDFKLYCSDAAYQYDVASPDCNEVKPYFQEQIQEDLNQQPNNNIQQPEIERRKVQENDVSGYAGIALGAFFPDEENLDTGFGESIFVGGRWNKYLATDIEAIYFSGGGELLDPDYFAWALTINPRLIIPFNNDYNSASIYISPGLGVSIVGNYDDATTTLAWQIKGGFTIPIEDQFNIFLQGRYASQFKEDTIGVFGTQIGFSVNFQ